MMKRNIKFFTIIISLLLVSSLALTGCMHAIATDNGEMKPYDLNSQQKDSNALGSNIVEGDAPTAQDSLQAKFEAMYDISEDGKSITVITEEYLNNYWQSCYEKEVIHSLTTEEIYFIIQDSIRIYEEYDAVILSEFGSFSSDSQIASWIPYVREQTVINTKPMKTHYDEYVTAIYEIIMYRLKALSSPKAFFTGAEAIRFNGGLPEAYNSLYPETVFYIPGYSADTDRDYILSVMGGNKSFTEIDGFPSLFEVALDGEEGRIRLCGSADYIFPTVEMLDFVSKIQFFPYSSLGFIDESYDVMTFEWTILSDDDMELLRQIYNDGKHWTDDSVVNREPFYFDGRIRFAAEDTCGWMYFGFEQSVLYYNGMFTSMNEQVRDMLNRARLKADGTDESNTEDTFTKGSVIYSSGENRSAALSVLLWSKYDNGDGTYTETQGTGIKSVLSDEDELAQLYVPMLYTNQQNAVEPLVPVNGQITNVYLLNMVDCKNDPMIETTWEEIQELNPGRYYVVTQVLLSGNCDLDAPQHSFCYEDLFCLVVEEKIYAGSTEIVIEP